MPETPNKDARQLNRQSWEPAGVVSVIKAKAAPKGTTATDKGGALKLEVENTLHDEGLMLGEERS